MHIYGIPKFSVMCLKKKYFIMLSYKTTEMHIYIYIYLLKIKT